MTTALITGASGFIGGHLAEALQRRGVQVRCLVRRPQACTTLRHTGAELVAGDVTNLESLRSALAGVDVVYHLAARTSAHRVEELIDVNARGTENVARACAAQQRPPVHLLVSSIAAAGPAAPGQVRLDDHPAAPVSHYGRSKRAGERAAEAYASIVPTTVVRPGIVFGERNREMLPMFSTIDRTRCHPQPGFRSPPLSLIYVHDLIELTIRAAERGRRIAPVGDGESAGQGYYFACAARYPNYGELGQMLARAMGMSGVRVLPLVAPLPWIAAGANQLWSRARGVCDSFNIDKIREATVASWACSPAAAARDLGFDPDPPLEDQLRATADWYRQNRWIGERPLLNAVRQWTEALGTPRLTLRPFGQRRRA